MSISDPARSPHPHLDALPRLAGLAAVLVGACAGWVYWRAGLTLSHYDARAHLVVARRVIDSLTPGWTQVGAVWLPLPHLINLFPVQIDVLYRTGASATAVSILSFGVLGWAATRLVLDATGSRSGAAAALAVLLLSPDLLYLQATPMTEPLLLGLTTLSLALLGRWVRSEGRRGPAATGVSMAAACLTRYEAWPVTAAALLLAVAALWRQGETPRRAAWRVAGLAVFPAAAVLAFFLQSRLTVGRWFVAGGFYVVDNPDLGRPFKTIGSIWWASHHLIGYVALFAGVAGAVALLVSSLRRKERMASIVALAMGACAALPWYAFVSGHPFRFRYAIPLIPALAVWAGIGVGLAGRFRPALAGLLIVAVAAEVRPFGPSSQMVLEAQLDSQHAEARETVTEYLRQHRRGGRILASLGSLSHYVQELSQIGVNVRDVIHEGNGELWLAALELPQSHAEWILIEEQAEGGDLLASRARERPGFLLGFRRVAEGGGVALYAVAR